MKRDIQAEIIELLETVTDLPISGSDAELLDTGVLDSLAMIDLLTGLEECFGIEISVDDLELDTFRTPRAIDAFVRERMTVRLQADDSAYPEAVPGASTTA